MRFIKYVMIAFVLVFAFTTTEMSAKKKMVPSVYMFGFSASFADSTVYFTDMQQVDSAWIDSKTKFLLGRDNYALQLKNYFANSLKMKNRTCVVIFGIKRKDAEKKYNKMKRIYTVKAKNKYDVKYLNASDFKFNCIDMSVEGE